MDQALLALNEKLDRLTNQVAYLTEQTQRAERERESRTELMRDLTPIVNDVYRLTVEQLEEVEQYVSLDDLLRLVKRLARNGRNIEKMLDQLESVMDLAETIVPLSDAAFGRAVTELATLERKGYFTFAKGGWQIMDNIVTSFGEDDVRQLGNNVVLILRTIKEMTQPEVMNFARNMVSSIESESAAEVSISYRSLFGQMRDPNVRRGLALTMRVLHSLGQQMSPAGQSVN
ncbi:MAG: hypothetical protein WAW03_22995 [Anaerolineae bacterium]|uniref:DUF1641 domain-containing protein n=1 Tax=Candidatus Amarolinea dominans TaxID=3140696 RepID=UPI001DF9EF13|nr:DUF1641 domain-containing protein [Anaerolineae bacterium]MBK7200572.1 DUF1641 domain-containing protein [Anaerolineae bacterium]MBK9092846.1 DUF1641 domain-containing protein [Anaerolineae bacterium]